MPGPADSDDRSSGRVPLSKLRSFLHKDPLRSFHMAGNASRRDYSRLAIQGLRGDVIRAARTAGILLKNLGVAHHGDGVVTIKRGLSLSPKTSALPITRRLRVQLLRV
jgi:hypothetical protein